MSEPQPPVEAARPFINVSPRYRLNRFRMFRGMLEELARTRSVVRVLDMGGWPDYWQDMRPLWQDLPLHLTIVNIDITDRDDPPYHSRYGSALDMAGYADNSFDIVHSNSVIEHVGQWVEMQAMAREVRRLAPRYFVQTPNLWFPYEPHYRSLFLHWFPEPVRAAMVLRKRRGFIEASSYDQAMREVQDIHLLSARQMAELFPDARIEREKVGPFTKSLIAIR
ncbi:class I SAM-dependent methyltransferase [Sphingomonas sp. VNH70]|uniref:class I SAM-dependent methyltransferase n=1 Tax=Sphingomonas silueang TaxID=3156617 RepID=UPI0032B4C753